MEVNDMKIRDLLNQKEQLLREKIDLDSCIKEIDKELEHIKEVEIKDIFETIKPYLDRLEKLRVVVVHNRYIGHYDPPTGIDYDDIGYIIERI